MARDGPLAPKMSPEKRRYRLCDTAIITLDDSGFSPGQGSYAKSDATGALFRLGHEETLLLTELGSGLSVEAISKEFAHRLQINISPDAVGDFARDMVQNGLLEDREEGESYPPVATRTEPDEQDIVLPSSEALGSEELFDDKDPFDELTDKVFDNDEPEDELSGVDHPDYDAQDDGPDDVNFSEMGFEGRRPRAKKSQPVFPSRGPANAKVTQRNPEFKRSQPSPVRIIPIKLFNPTVLLDTLNSLFGWIGVLLSWLIIPMAVVALLSIFHRVGELMATLSAGYTNLGLIGLLALSMLTVNLATRLVIGIIIRREGGEVPSFGITFLFFLIPRFAVDTTNLFRLDRKGRMRVFAGALKTRLLIFALCTFFWDGSRLGGTGFSELVAILGQMSLLSFLISAFPLLSGEGYRLMTAYFDEPLLRERSLGILFGRGKDSKLPPAEGRQWWVFVLYGLSVIIFSAFVVMLLAAYASTALVGRFGGTGVIIFVSLIGLMLLWLIVTKSQSKRIHTQIAKQVIAEKRTEKAAAAGAASNAGPALQLPALRSQTALTTRSTALTNPRANSLGTARPLPGRYAKNAGPRWGSWFRRVLLLAALGTAVYVAFLPYQYDAGGNFTILPDTRVQVIARVPGELAEVVVNEGDTVQAGDVLARQTGTEERHAFAVSRAALAKAEAQFETLQSGSTPEELRIAQEQVSRVESELPFLEAEAVRANELVDRGAIPQSQAEAIISRLETTSADLRTAQANLESVQAPAQASEIAASRADIDRLSAEVSYYGQLLQDTELVAPVSGRVVIIGTKPVRGTYLQTGELLMEIEDHRFSQAEIQLPETDISLIRTGQTVRLKTWAMPDQEWLGTVTSIAPVAEQMEFGQVVRVRTRLPNESGLFRPGMTGFAKIEGPEMRVWEAYSRLFARFLLVEIWGWIP